MNQLIGEYFDRVWIYGDESIVPTADIYNFTDSVRSKAVYCGYLVGKMPRQIAAADSIPYIVATVGGGRDGRRILEFALESVARLRESHSRFKLFLFTGPLMSQRDFALIRRKVGRYRKWAKVERFSNRLKRYLIGADAIITMGGYNTMLECIAAHRPAIVIPRETPRSEQALRAEIFERHGCIKTVRLDQLHGDLLCDRLKEIVVDGWRPCPSKKLRLDGYENISREIRDLCADSAPIQSKKSIVCCG